MKPNKRIIIKIIIAILCTFLLFIGLFFGIKLYVELSSKDYIITPENAPKSDAVIILGALVYKNGRPSDVLKDRLEYGYALYKNGKAKKILVSGDHGTKEYDEVNTMKDYLLNKGVPREDIFLDHAGFDTYDSMFRAKEIFGIKTMLISTQVFHMSRAIYIARKLGIDAYGYPSDDSYVYNMTYNNIRESFATIKAFIDTDLIKRNPKYLGKPIPISGSGILTEG